jgi:hypothetical protein
MKLLPIEIFKGKKILFNGGTSGSADTHVRMSPKGEKPYDELIKATG